MKVTLQPYTETRATKITFVAKLFLFEAALVN